jgi:hypothetical protein
MDETGQSEIRYTKNQLYKMRMEELRALAAARGITLSGDEKEKDIVDAIYNKQQTALVAGNGEEVTLEKQFAELAELDPSTKIDVTVGLLLAMASQIATDVVNTAYAAFEAGNTEALAQARSLGERIDNLTREVQAIQVSLKARDSLHGTIEQLGKI